MGNRGRLGSRGSRADAAMKINSARKEFTRAKALRALSAGADFNDMKFTNHRNYHIRQRVWEMAGAMVPETIAERETLCDLLSRGRTLAGRELIKDRLGLNADNVVEEAAA